MTSSAVNGVVVTGNDWHSYGTTTWPCSNDKSKKLSKMIRETTFYNVVSISGKLVELPKY